MGSKIELAVSPLSSPSLFSPSSFFIFILVLILFPLTIVIYFISNRYDTIGSDLHIIWLVRDVRGWVSSWLLQGMF